MSNDITTDDVPAEHVGGCNSRCQGNSHWLLSDEEAVVMGNDVDGQEVVIGEPPTDPLSEGENARGLGPVHAGIPANTDEPPGTFRFEDPIGVQRTSAPETEAERGTYRAPIVSARMNSDGDVMDKEWAVGVIFPTSGDKYPEPERVSDWVSERGPVDKAIASIRESATASVPSRNVVLYRYVSDVKVEGRDNWTHEGVGE